MKSRLKGSFTLQCYRPANLLNLLNSNPEFTQAAWHDLSQRGKQGGICQRDRRRDVAKARQMQNKATSFELKGLQSSPFCLWPGLSSFVQIGFSLSIVVAFSLKIYLCICKAELDKKRQRSSSAVSLSK